MADQRDWRARLAKINDVEGQARKAQEHLADWPEDARDEWLTQLERERGLDPRDRPSDWRERVNWINDYEGRARREEERFAAMDPEARDALLTGLERQ